MRVVVESGPAWWVTALIAFGAALAGAFVGAGFAAVFAMRQRVRTARAAILTDYLPPLHDPVAEATATVQKTGEPQPHGEAISEALRAP